MSEFDGPPPADSTPSELPGSVVGKSSTDEQVDFEIDFYTRLLEQDPNYLEVLRVLANNLSAKSLHAEGLEVDLRIVRLCPNDDVALYNLACSYSLLGMVDSSLEVLKRAIESGYDEFDYMRLDTDLEATRRDPRFLELLAAFGAG